jgi:hypothetical protein
VLARRGRFREGDEHVAAAIRLFEAEGLDSTPIRIAGDQPGPLQRRSPQRRFPRKTAIGVDGMDEGDLHNYLATHPNSAFARLTQHGR